MARPALARATSPTAFQRRWPDAYEDFEAQLRFPIPLGTAVRIFADTNCPWQTILFVSTLHHLETLDAVPGTASSATDCSQPSTSPPARACARWPPCR